MPRKTRAKAEHETKAADFNRWRLLVRNPAFLKDLLALRKLGLRAERQPELLGRFMEEEKRLADKWGLLRIPGEAICTTAADPEGLEWCYLRQGDKQGPYPIEYSPVALTELKEDQFLFLRVDVTKPLDLVLAAAEPLLRGFYKTRAAKRGRLDSLDFQLAVFDLVQLDGKDFAAVARQLGKPVSTVRSAYVAACRKIGVAGAPPRKPRVPEVDPGPIERCPDPRCRSARTPEDFCPAHRAYSEQDQVYLREYLPRLSTREPAG